MNITRRRFIRNLSTAAAAAAAAFTAIPSSSKGGVFAQALSQSDGSDLTAVPATSWTDPLSYLTRAHFEPFVDSFVRVQTGEKQIELRLVEVKDLKRETNERRFPSGGESFSLLFEDTLPLRLGQDVYALNHDSLGEFSLLLVPTGIKGTRYEAVINRVNAAGNR